MHKQKNVLILDYAREKAVFFMMRHLNRVLTVKISMTTTATIFHEINACDHAIGNDVKKRAIAEQT